MQHKKLIVKKFFQGAVSVFVETELTEFYYSDSVNYFIFIHNYGGLYGE